MDVRSLSKSEEARFKTLLADCHRAWDTLRPENATPFYAKDRGLVFYNLRCLRQANWKSASPCPEKMGPRLFELACVAARRLDVLVVVEEVSRVVLVLQDH